MQKNHKRGILFIKYHICNTFTNFGQQPIPKASTMYPDSGSLESTDCTLFSEKKNIKQASKIQQSIITDEPFSLFDGYSFFKVF